MHHLTVTVNFKDVNRPEVEDYPVMVEKLEGIPSAIEDVFRDNDVDLFAWSSLAITVLADHTADAE